MSEIMLRNPAPGWKMYRLGQLFVERREKVSDKDFAPLSVTMNGIVPQLDSAAKSDDGDNRKLVRAGDYVINSRSDRKGSGGISPYDGSVSLISIVLEPKRIDPAFAHHLLRSAAFQEEFYRWGHGIVADLWTTRYSDMKNIRLYVPDLATQRQIADFLDRETARIDLLIEKKQRFVALLGEKVRAYAFNAVTQGISPGVQMRRSNLLHQETLPQHWQEVALGKKITLQRGVDITKDEQNQDGQYPVISSGGILSYHDKFTCRGPGVLIGRKGSAGRLHYSDSNYWAHDTTLYVKNFFGNDPKFVFYKLATIDLESFDRSSANPTINRNFVHPVKVSWAPDISEQKSIVESIERLKKQVEPIDAATNASIIRLREYRSALITAAVTGQLDVTTHARAGTTYRQLDRLEEMDA